MLFGLLTASLPPPPPLFPGSLFLSHFRIEMTPNDKTQVELRQTEEERDTANDRATRAESERDALLEEIEELTRALFEEANRMVSEERKKGHVLTTTEANSASSSSSSALSGESSLSNLARIRAKVSQLGNNSSANSHSPMAIASALQSRFKTRGGVVVHDGVSCDG
jgi:GDP/GTP exchange factor Sec2p